MSKSFVYFSSGILLLVIAAVYWPVIHANFIWDDWQSFHDMPWLTQGDQWEGAIFHGFNAWTFYFRPLVVALFTLQVRAFHSTPGPMHAVSLAIHLIDTVLVGILSWQWANFAGKTFKNRAWIIPLCMAVYGLHAALIEPVAWIGCQFDLVATMVMLLGLIANLGIQKKLSRAACLTAIFFLAACAKESAISFPLLVVLFDWIIISKEESRGLAAILRNTLQRNWLAYGGMLLAGSCYIALRYWALGSLTNGLQGDPITSLAKLREISSVYVNYWKIIVWPISGLNPIHPFEAQQFASWSEVNATMTVVGACIFIFGLYAAIKHRSPIGWIILAVTAALFPVLHVIPGQFERSLYHERYATMALAVLCAMLPLLHWNAQFFLRPNIARVIKPIFIGAAFLWLAFSIVDIRLTLPMWSNDVSLWRWALVRNPQAPQAKGSLLLSYTRTKDFESAMKFSDALLADPTPCFECMISIAELALTNDDLPRAHLAIDRMSKSQLLKEDNHALQTYHLLTGRLLMQENKLDAAEKEARAAIALDPKNPKPQNLLKEILAQKQQSISAH